MKKNNLFRKGLVVGIICILLITTSSLVIGSNNQKKSTTSITIVNYEGSAQCDLVIYDIEVEFDRVGFPSFIARIKNQGHGSVPGGWNPRTTVMFRKALTNKLIHTATGSYSRIRPHLPEEIINHPIWFNVEPIWSGIYRVYFKTDPDNKVDEISEKNNGAWAYLYVFVLYYVYGTQWVGIFFLSSKLHLWDPTNTNIQYDLEHMQQSQKSQQLQQNDDSQQSLGSHQKNVLLFFYPEKIRPLVKSCPLSNLFKNSLIDNRGK